MIPIFLRLLAIAMGLIVVFAGGITFARQSGIGAAPEQILYTQTDGFSINFYLLGLDGRSTRFPFISDTRMASAVDCTPNGDQIALTLSYVLVNVPRDSSLQRINLPPGWIGGIALSPDGSQVIITGVFPQYTALVELYTLDFATEEMTRLTENNMRELGVSWSPDGTRIVFNYLDENGGSGIGMIEMENPSDVQIVRAERVSIETPDWSPDGTQLAYASGTTFGSELYVIPIDGSTPTRVVQMGTPIIRVRWSSDGSMISFNRLNVRDGWQVFALDLPTRLLRRLTYSTNGYQSANGCWVAASQWDAVPLDAAAS